MSSRQNVYNNSNLLLILRQSCKICILTSSYTNIRISVGIVVGINKSVEKKLIVSVDTRVI